MKSIRHYLSDQVALPLRRLEMHFFPGLLAPTLTSMLMGGKKS